MTGQALELYLGRKRTGISIEPDPVWPGMWRIRFRTWSTARISDMVNRTRACEAAVTWTRRGPGERCYWRPIRSPAG